MLPILCLSLSLTFGVFGPSHSRHIVNRWFTDNSYRPDSSNRFLRAKDILTLNDKTYTVGAQTFLSTTIFVVRPLNTTHHSLHVALWYPYHAKRHIIDKLKHWYVTNTNTTLVFDAIAFLDDSDAFISAP